MKNLTSIYLKFICTKYRQYCQLFIAEQNKWQWTGLIIPLCTRLFLFSSKVLCDCFIPHYILKLRLTDDYIYHLVTEGSIPESGWSLARVFMRLMSEFRIKIPRDVIVSCLIIALPQFILDKSKNLERQRNTLIVSRTLNN